MQSKKRTILLLILVMFLSLLSGCTPEQTPADAFAQPGPIERQQSNSVARRFKASAPQNPTAVESAIELSEKYAELSEEAAVLQQQNQDLIGKNQQLKERTIALEAQLQQTQKELTEANDVLIQMRIELNNWKSDILGFRNEMRSAETAQLEALLKILQVLGGEVRAEAIGSLDTSSTVGSASGRG